jgi:multidrug efflux system membrane fusion protein
MKSSYFIAGGVAALAAAWILSGQVGDPERSAHANDAPVADAPAEPLKRVRVKESISQPQYQEIVIRGRTQASRAVGLRAETAGRIARIMAEEGKRVDKGAPLARIDPAERIAALAEAEALLRQRQIEFNAAKALSEKGYRSDTKLAEAAAHLDAARARVSQMKTDIDRTTIRAPFDGILEKRLVELGDYVKIGDDIARVVDLDPVFVVGAVSEREVGALKVGAAAIASLVDGRRLSGILRFIGAVADAATRTFRVELEIPNPEGSIRDGITSQIHLKSAEVRAHFLSPALLTLDDAGRLGIKAVDQTDRVVFHPVRILSDKPGGIWVLGLPDRINLITVGQEFVRVGQKVRSSPHGAESAS